MTDEQLILFTRYPEAGTAKTRLIPALGEEGAADLQRRMAEQVAVEAAACAAARGARFEIRYDGGDADLVSRWLTPLAAHHGARPQGNGDLGKRMARALEQGLAEGRQRVVLVGSDCPGLSAALMARALAALVDHDLVLGPALDGGYYLIGLSSPQPVLFADMEWGMETVLSRTLERAQIAGLRICLLEALGDVDRPEDLAHLDHHPHP